MPSGLNWRINFGHPSQVKAKNFLSGRDIYPKLDVIFLEKLVGRCSVIFKRLNSVVHLDLRHSDIDSFIATEITEIVTKLSSAGLLQKLNNHGRRSECMAFNWLRGYATLMFFMPAIEKLFGAKKEDIAFAGKDHDLDIKTFKKSPLADITIKEGLRAEIQAGFQGKNDIKEHKIIEALRQSKKTGTKTILLHFDIFNGFAAVIDISTLGKKKLTYVQRAAMEGKRVFEIPENWFYWDLTKPMPQKLPRLFSQK